MKLLLAIFLLFIKYVICDDDNKYVVKKYPKKVMPFGSGKILINSGKYMFRKKSPATIKPQNTNTTFGDFYTVFQLVGNSKVVHGIPDSPYFPNDQPIEHKPRVKKVLSDYVWSRIKRSVDEANKEEPPKPDVNITEPSIVTLKHTLDTEKANVNNETVKPNLRSNDDHKTSVDVKKAVTKVKNKGNHTDTKHPDKDAKSEKKDGTTTSSLKSVRKGKSKGIGRVPSKKTNTTRPKTRSRGKSQVRNGTALKKGKQSSKRQGRSKKNKKNKKSASLRHPKGNQTEKHSKKKQSESKGNTTELSNSKETRRLTSAQEALIEDYPYVVSIQKNEEHWCSGALLNPRLVITTANCLWKSNHLSRMSVRAGSSFTDRGGQVAKIQEVMKHPKWGLRRNPDNDLALILLDKTIRFSHSVHGVDLPNRVMQPAFQDAWIASWGSERRDGIFDIYENALQVVHSYLMNNETCNNITRRFGITVSENFLCFSQAGKTAPCTRDTGAPAVSDGILWGLASWGIRKLCGTERFPAMFSYTASHSNMDFIANATTYLMSEKRYYPFADRPPSANQMWSKPEESSPPR